MTSTASLFTLSSLTLPPPSLPLTHWPPCCSLNSPGLLYSQSLMPGKLFPYIATWLTSSSPGLYSNISFPERPFLAPLSKTLPLQCLQSALSFPCLFYFAHWPLIHSAYTLRIYVLSISSQQNAISVRAGVSVCMPSAFTV